MWSPARTPLAGRRSEAEIEIRAWGRRAQRASHARVSGHRGMGRRHPRLFRRAARGQGDRLDDLGGRPLASGVTGRRSAPGTLALALGPLADGRADLLGNVWHLAGHLAEVPTMHHDE